MKALVPIILFSLSSYCLGDEKDTPPAVGLNADDLARAVVGTLDEDESGGIELDEALKHASRLFASMDKNGDGKIDRHELLKKPAKGGVTTTKFRLVSGGTTPVFPNTAEGLPASREAQDACDGPAESSKSLSVSGSVDATGKIWDMRDSKSCVCNFPGHEADINTVQWFADSKAILTGSDDGTVRMFMHVHTLTPVGGGKK